MQNAPRNSKDQITDEKVKSHKEAAFCKEGWSETTGSQEEECHSRCEIDSSATSCPDISNRKAVGVPNRTSGNDKRNSSPSRGRPEESSSKRQKIESPFSFTFRQRLFPQPQLTTEPPLQLGLSGPYDGPCPSPDLQSLTR